MRQREVIRIFKIILGLLFAIVISYNFFVALDYKYEAEGDAASFIGLGIGLAKFNKYGHVIFPEGQEEMNAFKENRVAEEKLSFGGHSTWRPPVWPFLIAGVFLIFGYNLTYLIILKFFLHLLGTFLFYKTLKLFEIRQILLVVGTFIYGVSPAWQLYSRVFLSEPITFFFITLWIYLLVRFIQNKSAWWPQALVAGIIVLCHPYYIFLPFSVWLFLLINKQVRIKYLILSSALCVFVISTWIIRNFLVLETNEVVLTTSSGAVMAKGWNKSVPEKHTNTKGDLADETLVLQDFVYDKNRRYNEVERMVLYKDASLYFIKTHPEMILPIIRKKLTSAFNPFPETARPGILETGRWIFQFFALIALVYLLTLTRNRFIISLALALIISTLGISILTYSGFRFRMPQVGLELLLIIYAVDDFVKRRKTNPKSTSIE